MPAYTIKPLVTATAINTGGRNGHSETTDHSVSVNLSVRKTEVKRKRAELGEFRTEKIEVKGRLGVGAIVHESVRADLRRRQLVGDVNRRLGPAELKRSKPAHVSDDDHTVLVDHDGLLPAERFERRRNFIDRTLGNFARVFFVRRDFAQRADLDLHAATRVDDSPAAVGASYTSEWHLGFLGNRNFATF